MSFNDAQKRAIEHVDGPMIVLAGPGSGKTTVITHRVKFLIETAGVAPSGILVVTFTKAAASEMKNRFLKLTGQKSAPVSFGTFHAVFFTILKHAYGFTAASVLTSEKRREIFENLAERYQLEVDDEAEFMESMASEISLIKSEMISPDTYYSVTCAADIFRKFFESYQRCLRQQRLLDFDDMMLYTYRLFKERPDILKAWQNKFKYILVDEFQDVSRLQYEIVRMLAAPEDNLFIVGDDDQSIYHFRGARPEIMLNFPKDYPKAAAVTLGVNYRSTPNIVEAAVRLIEHNSVRYKKKLRAAKDIKAAPVLVKAFKTPKEENAFVLSDIRRLHDEEKMRFSDIAVLFRTNHGARAIVSAMMNENIPFRMKDMLPNIFNHWIMKDILACHRIASGGTDRKDYLRIINRPNRYISRRCFDQPTVDFEQIKNCYEDKLWMQERLEAFEEDIYMFSTLPPFAAVNYLRKAMEYDRFLYEYAMDKHMRPEDLTELTDTIQESARPFQTWEAWLEDIEKYGERLKAGEFHTENEDWDGVVLSTMHGAKGLEYEAVYIIDANEKIVPYQKAVLDEEVEEERRLFYVAMTRAKRFLDICFVKERHSKTMEVSRFVTEILRN